MRKFFIVFTAFLLPICASASIEFNITHTTTGAHESHIVKAPIAIFDRNNNTYVTYDGMYDVMHQGLDTGETKSVQWTSGWIFNTNISGYYTIYPNCNMDGQIFTQPTDFKILFIADGTKANINIECKVTSEGALLPPITTVQLQKQEG